MTLTPKGKKQQNYTLSAEALATLAATGIADQGWLQQPRPTITCASDWPRELSLTLHRIKNLQPPASSERHLWFSEEREPSLTSRSRQKSLLATRSCCNLQGKTAGRESSPPPEHPIEIQNRLHDQPPLTGDERQMDLERDRKDEHPQPRTRVLVIDHS